MRKLALLFLLFPLAASAQTKETYCELLAEGKAFSRKVHIRVDFGQKTSFWKGIDVIRDKVSGKAKKFNSVIDALNFMGAEGWTLVNAFPISVGNQKVLHYVFKKEVPADEFRDVDAENYDPDNAENGK